MTGYIRRTEPGEDLAWVCIESVPEMAGTLRTFYSEGLLAEVAGETLAECGSLIIYDGREDPGGLHRPKLK